MTAPSASPSAAAGLSLRSLVVAFWLVGTVLLSACLTALQLLERQRQLGSDAEHTQGLVAAALASNLSEEQRQALISSYAHSAREDLVDGLNVLLVVDQAGQIVYSSRPGWRQLSVSDPLFSQQETDDPDFQGLVRCFQSAQRDCTRLESPLWRLPLQRFSVVRGVQMPALDLGRRPERFLVVVNYDQGLLRSGLLLQWLLSLVLSLLISGLLALLIWLLLAGYVLPRLTALAQTDPLTQLMNRGIFMELAKGMLAEAEERQAELVLAILDIDHFKRINDTHGHVGGDAALRHLAEIFRGSLREDDLLCRLGGEEFALLLVASRQQASRALERLRLQLEMSTLQHRGHRLTIQTSVGAVACRDCGYNLDYLYSAADQALYSAKRAGRNRVAWSEGRVLSRLAP